MTANQFYVPLIAEDAERIVLQGDEHRHLARAARVRAGEEIWLFDGRGRRCHARVEKVTADRTDVVVLETEEPEQPRARIALAACLVESKKLETILEKAAELGCSDFIPVVERAVPQGLGREDGPEARTLAEDRPGGREAVQGAPSDRGPSAAPARGDPPRSRRGEAALPERARRTPAQGRPDRCGPAAGGAAGPGPAPRRAQGRLDGGGGEEIRQAGFEAVSLGRRILRAETAALAGAAMIAHFWNE